MPGFAFQQRQHGLMAPVHPIEVANGQGAFRCQLKVLVTTKNFHRLIIGSVPAWPGRHGPKGKVRKASRFRTGFMISLYID